MSDPSIEAAKKAWNGTGVYRTIAENAAREALKPIRERHAHWVAELEKSPLPATAGAIALVVLADLAPLIFTTEELER
ncbi:hypothetical protein [Mycobacteroides abscessus]|uniref:hypothetical protein n=1 Tax=Mycobacteroides abscessus TaxID=36809 RepID=UPI00092AD3E2|nr:hypothetical protein [Mycobacteroides abscessus]SIC86986.1 Uncharacterised protein [Mycobacteroides abscessus subsp. bolletii]SKT75417.1 Uncharacterised protein [Mycobacteroides abscessus subsp. bolletii]SLD35341.1 Uncharacterised protein [Mycobacteroides abscessus subsp. bolletii]SLF79540.1 Uncharacterised protein [Mycobacteroides abscessus subsp. bolletii]